MIVKINLDTCNLFRVIERKEDMFVLDIGDDMEIEVPRRICEAMSPCVTVVVLEELDNVTAGGFYPAYPVKTNMFVLRDNRGKLLEVDTSAVSVVQDWVEKRGIIDESKACRLG